MSGRAAPMTRSQANVSSSLAPTLVPGRRMRSLGAALAGGSPQSSPSPSGSDRAQSPGLGVPFADHYPLHQQAATSQGATHPTPLASSTGHRAASAPTGGSVADDDVILGSPTPGPPSDIDVEMESATTREVTFALRVLKARLTDRKFVERAVDEAKAKFGAATSDDAIVSALPNSFKSDVREYVKSYRSEVEALASARSSVSKLRKHRIAKTYPLSLNSIKPPSIQFSRAFVNAPTTDGHRRAYNNAAGGSVVFEQSVESAVKALKEGILSKWIREKDKEVTFLESKASVSKAISSLEGVVQTKFVQLRARYDYLSAHPIELERAMVDVNSAAITSLALAASVITKVTTLVLDEEDRKLETALKKMAIVKPAQAAGSQAPGNDISELKKMVSDLTKKVELQSKKVRNGLHHLLCVCAGHLSLTRPLLESLLTGLVEAGWEEVGWTQEGEGEESKDRHYRKQKGQENQSRRGRQVQGQGQRQGRRSRCEVKAAGQQEEGWQEVSATFGLCFGTDSASACSVSVYGLYDFSVEYGLDWNLLATSCRFLCLSFHPSMLLNARLRRLVQICCVVYVLSMSTPKFHIFDYTTYPDLVVRMEQDLLFMILSRFAPEWLLSCRRFTSRLHSNLDVEVPKEVVDTFSAGLKYLSPIAMKKSLVKESWIEFTDRALKSWAGGYHERDKENDSDEDPFYLTPIPFKLHGHVLPFEGDRDRRIMRILQAGWRDLNSLLSNVPNLDRNGRSFEVESKNALEWCFTENVLVKA